MAHRELVFHITGCADYKNKAFLSLSKSKNAGETYFGFQVPEERYEHPRIQINMGYNVFQYLGPKKTRHIEIWNTDPKLDYLPAVFMNYMMT